MPIRDKILEIARDMPAAPRVFAQLDKMLREGRSSLDEICILIRTDAALTTHLLRVSNSVVYAGRRRVGSVEAAVSRVGLQELYRVVGFVAGTQMTEQTLAHYGIHASRLREHMVRTAFVSEQLATECGLDARMAYTAGLLRSIGLFVCDQLAAQYDPVPAYRPGNDHDYLTWEGRIFGIGNCEVAALVLEEWKFPEEIIAAVRHHYRPEVEDNNQRLACLLNLASGLVAKEGHGLPGETGHWAKPQDKIDALGLSDRRFQAAEARATESFAGFHRRMQGDDEGSAGQESLPSSPAAGKVSPETCDLEAPAGVLEGNDEPTVHTTHPGSNASARFHDVHAQLPRHGLFHRGAAHRQ